MHPECTAYDYERFREQIKNILNKNEICLVLDLPTEKKLQCGILYFSLNRWAGEGVFFDEFKARKKLLDFLSDVRKLCADSFSLATIDCKEIGEGETYFVLVLNSEKEPITLLTFRLSAEKKMVILRVEFPDVFGFIKQYRNLLSRSSSVPSDSFPVQVGVIVLNDEKETVKKYCEEICALLREKYTIEVLHLNQNYRDEETRWLESGVPVIVEIGRIAAKNRHVILVGREERRIVPFDSTIEQIGRIGRINKENFFGASLKRNREWMEKVSDYSSLKQGNRFCCCLNSDCLNRIREDKGFQVIAQTFSDRLFSEECILCGKRAKACLFGLMKK